jgi:hypothetical protein
MVILYIIAGLSFIYLSGLYITNILFKDNNQATSLNLAVGYITTQLLFLIGIYASNAYYSLYFILGLFIIFSLINIKSIIVHIKQINIKLLLLLIALIGLIGFDLIYYGLNSYWHTASEDCFDAINGRDYLLGNVKVFAEFILNQDPFVTELLKIHHQTIEEVVADNKILSYFNSNYGDNSKIGGWILQYTTVTFWSIFFNTFENLDAFLLQSIINIIMMFYGIQLLTKEIFKFSNINAFITALISVYSNLYLTTYFNTHQGSMMFAAVMPYVLYLFFKYEKNNFQNKIFLFLILLMSIFLLFTYKHPYVFFIIPAIVYILRNKIFLYLSTIMHNKVYLFIFILIIILSSLYMYGLLEHYLNFKAGRFRSWGISLEPEMILIYWGLVQSQVTNIGASTGMIYNNLIIKYILYAIATIYMLITLYGYSIFSKRNIYFKYFMSSWILFFIVFKFLLADPYYFYKFLYSTQFIFLIFFIYGLNIIYNKKNFKIVSIIVFTLFISSNIYYNINSNIKIHGAMQNKNSKAFERILEIPDEILKKSFLDIPTQFRKLIVQTEARKKYIFTRWDINNADYIVLMKGIEDIYFSSYNNTKVITIFENKSFKVIKKPKYYLSLYGPWESEVVKSNIGNFSNMPFRWMSHDINKGNIIITSKTNKKYLQACFESGPSIDFGEFDININNKIYASQGIECKYFEIKKNKILYRLYSTVKGKKLFPFDSRSLEYKIANVRNTNIKYDIDVLQILNPKNDIANHNFKKSNNIVVGNGWYPQELVNMRWGSDNVELLVMNSTMENIKVEFDIEVGPSLKAFPLKIEILNDEDMKIGYIEVDKRKKITINLSIKKEKRYQILKLKVLNDTKKLDADPRDLNFRVFSMKVVK